MFAEACQKVMKYTRPVAVSTRNYDGTCNTDIATMIVINSDGWAITAGHVFDSFIKHQNDLKKIKEIEELNASKTPNPNSPPSEIKIDKGMITNHSFWWGRDGIRLNNVLVNRQVDIAIGKLEPFDSSWVTEYPVFADPSHMRIGFSICRAGYPFINFKPEFVEDVKAFRIPKVPSDEFFYPTEGIYTHLQDRGKSLDGSCQMKYIETSTPGLRGQSGGPIFDRNGHLLGMQIMTEHRPTGFHPVAELDGQKYVENQFMNIGIGIHVSTIFELLDSRNIRYSMEGDETGYRIIN